MIRPSDPGDALRHEIKLVCEESGYSALRMALRLLPSGLRELHPTRVVQSIYLDTALQRALEENRAGISNRSKIRFRWYGAGRELVQGTLERKRRANTLGWKETLALSESIRVEGAPRAGFVADLARAAGGAWRTRLERGLEPVQWIGSRVPSSRAIRKAWGESMRSIITTSPRSITPRKIVSFVHACRRTI